jgi:hypothetical protein
MIQLKILFIIFAFLTSSWIQADDSTNFEDAELIKLRIKELELKKEILELEAKKDNQTPHHSTSPQSYVSPTNSISGNDASKSSGYIRGPRGGCYTFSASGKKRYVDRSLCNQ